jgi:hypothetical protein
MCFRISIDDLRDALERASFLGATSLELEVAERLQRRDSDGYTATPLLLLRLPNRDGKRFGEALTIEGA